MNLKYNIQILNKTEIEIIARAKIFIYFTN